MEVKNKTLLFIYKNMNIGGIETYLIRLIRQLKRTGNRILWLVPADRYIDDGFKNDLLDGYVEIIEINIKRLNWIKHSNIKFSTDEEVIALAFDPVDYLRLETIKKKYKEIRIDSFFWVPHFCGKDYFIEEQAIRPLQSIVRKGIGKIIKDMEKNGNIFYVNKSHLEAFASRYKYKVENEKDKLIKWSTAEILPYDDQLALIRSYRDEFNIITVGRFEFPHKAYTLGLIKAYGELKEKYSQLKLTIIGFGIEENKVVEQINRLSPDAQEDVNFVGKVPYDDLRRYFENAHLNIGVASTIVDGSVTGLISIPVRHYSETCEGYGYLPDVKEKITSNEPGIPIEFFIEEVITMNQQKYQDYSKKAYDTYANGSPNDISTVLSWKNKEPGQTISNQAINAVRIYVGLIKMRHRINYESRMIAKKLGIIENE